MVVGFLKVIAGGFVGSLIAWGLYNTIPSIPTGQIGWLILVAGLTLVLARVAVVLLRSGTSDIWYAA